MATMKRLVQQIARIRSGCVVRFAGTTLAAQPLPAAGKDRFSVLSKVSPPARDAALAAKMKNLRPVSCLEFNIPFGEHCQFSLFLRAIMKR
jgi:hypothetical protein